MTVLNRKAATCKGGGIRENKGLCEKVKRGGFTSKGVSVTQQTSGRGGVEWGLGGGRGRAEPWGQPVEANVR